MTVMLDGVSLMSFEQASDAVVSYLKEKVPLGFWSVSEYRDGRQVYLSVQDDAYGKVAGDSHAWSDSFCQYMVTGQTPQIAPDAMAVPQYAAAGVARGTTHEHSEDGSAIAINPQARTVTLMAGDVWKT